VKIKKLFVWMLMSVGAFLTLVNVYGITQSIRVENFDDKYLRFPNDQPMPFESSLKAIQKNQHETDIQFAERMTKVVSRALSHVEWEYFPAEQFNQLIPIWENYFLYFLGTFSGIPEYERYHYANFERSIKRGIGVCGDASMVLSQLLEQHQIKNEIVTFPGHVVIAAYFDNGQKFLLDPDFGVVIPFGLDSIAKNSQFVANLYLKAGYTNADYQFFNRIYRAGYNQWQGVEHFITNKYYFEKISYWLKWPLPIVMILFAAWLWRIKIAKVKTS
jgi:hypothetical protein